LKQNGTAVSNVTQNIASGQLMVPIQYVAESTTGQDYLVTASLQLTQIFPYFVLSPTSGQTPLTINLYQQAVAPDGVYTGNLTITSTAAGTTALSVPVTITVGGTGGTGFLTSNPSSLTFTTVIGKNPEGQFLTVSAPNNAVTTFNASASTKLGGTWLQVFPTTNVPTGPSNLNNVAVAVDTTGLAIGTYDGTITLTPSGNQTATTVPVTLNITGAPTLTFSPTQLSFAYQTGTSSTGLTQTVTFSINSATPVFYTLAVQYGAGGSGWLVVNPLGGTVSTGVNVSSTVTVAPATLGPGTYSATIQVAASGTAVPIQSIPVTLLVSASPVLLLGTLPAPFNYQIGGAGPPAQSVTLSSSSTPLAYTTSVAYDTASGSSQWLGVSPGSGQTPATLHLSVNPTGLPAGKYVATVTVTAGTAANSPQQFQVVLNVVATTMFSTQTNLLVFNFQRGMLTPGAQQVQVTSTGAPIAFTVAQMTTGCGNWLNVIPAGGITPATLSISVVPDDITPAACHGVINVTASGVAPLAIPVVFNVSDQPLLNVVQNTLTFNVAPGSGASAPQYISLTSTDPSQALPFTAFARVAPGLGNWLFIGTGAGTTPANLAITVIPGSLGPGTYSGSVIISSPNAPSGYNIPVVLNVVSGVTAVSVPPAVNFVQTTGSTTPVSQTVQITVSDGSAASFNTFASVSSGGNWLSVSPAGAMTPATVTISANSNGQLSPGTYSGTVTIQMPKAQNSPLAIPVTLFIGTTPNTFTVAPAALTFTGTTGGTNPPTQTVQVTGSAATSSITVSAATTATTACGGNWLSVSPLSGSSPLTLTVTASMAGVSAGTCAGTITISAPGFTTATVNVTLNSVSTPAPAVSKVQNAASFAFGAVSPGELVYLEGSNLGPATLVGLTLDANGMVSTRLDDTEVLFDGQPAPLVYVSATKITAIVPYEVAGRQTTNIQVNHSGLLSTVIAQSVAATAPGIFTANASGAGQAAAVNIKETGFSYNGPACTSANPNCGTEPAPIGGVVSLYGTGEGQVSPQPPTGSVTGNTPPQVVAAVTVKLGGVPLDPSDVLYVGPAPTLAAGVLQINFRVPSFYLPGTTPVQVIIGSSTSNFATIEIGPGQ
jgi:uncharacterized protein (TIGR03437 family)